MAVVTLNKAGEDVTVGGSDVEVNGTPSGGEIITVVSGNVTFDPSFNQGGDTIVLPGLASDYTAYRVGAEVVLTRDDGAVSIRVPVGTAGIEIQFDGNDSRTLSFDTSTNPPVAFLEGQAISSNANTPTDITPAGPGPLVGYDVVGANTAVVEGDAGTRSMVFTITLDRPVTAADGPVTLNYVTQDGTADSTSDYVAAAGQVTFAVGQQVATVTVQVVGDTVPEVSETLLLQLTGADLRNGAETLTGTIANDDAAQPLSSKADNLLGSAGDDTWFAANGDLGAGDKITDPSTTDNDTLSLSVDQTYGAQTKGDTVYAGFTLTNVERIEVTNDSGEQVSLDLSGATGVQTVASINSSDSVLFDQLTSLADVELNNLTNVNKGDVEARYQAAVLAGANTTVNVDVINTDVDNVTLGGIGGDKLGVEVVNLNVTGTSTIDTLVNNSLRDLNINGTGGVTIDDTLSSSVRNIDATGTAGALDIDFTANDGAGFGVTFKGAQGVNTVASGTASDSITTYDADDVINDEGGNNTVNAGEGNNTVNTGSGNDGITTGSGNDTINAGDGTNTINAGDGANTVTVGTGTDFVLTGSGSDTVTDAGGNATIGTGDGADTVVLNGVGQQSVDAGEGDDIVDFNTDFDASLGSDSVNMGGGTDELRINAGAVDSQFRNVKSAEILTLETAGTTVLNNGTGGNGDSFAQAAGIQVINLNDGNDIVNAADFTSGLTVNSFGGAGDGGDDTVTTGVGNDTFNVNGTLTDADAYNAGGGNGDVLNIDGTTTLTDASKITGFEVINLLSSRDGTGTANGNVYTFGDNISFGLDDTNAPSNGLLTIDGSGLAADTDGVGGPLVAETVSIQTGSVTTYDLDITTGAADDFVGMGSTDHTVRTGDGDDFVAQLGTPGPNSGTNVVELGNGNDQFDVFQGGGKNTVSGGAGIDYIAIRAAGGQEIIDAGADNDVIRFAQNGVATILGADGDIVDGGDGFDYAYFNGSASYGPDSFANVTNVEALIAGDGGDKSTYVLGTAGEAAGIRTIYDADAFGGTYGASTYDASAYTDGVTFNFEGVTVDFGRIGPQTFEGGGNDKAIGGAGNDTAILGAVGNVTLVLNDGDDTVEAEGTELTYADAINGGAGNDTVLLDNTDGQVNAQVDLDVVTGVENFTVKSSGERFFGGDFDNNTITFRDGNVGSLTNINVDASALTDTDDTFTATIEASVDQEFQFNVTGSSTRDVLVRNQTFGGSNNNITFNAGAGDDEFRIGALDLGGIINYDGGDGTDTLFQLTDLGTIQDDDFVGVRNVEVLTGDVAFGDGIDALLGAAAADSGLQTVRGTTGSDDVRLDAGFDASTLEFVLGGGGNDVFRADATATVVTFSATANELTKNDDLRGGSTAGDVLNIVAGGTSNANNVVGVETINVNGDGVAGGAATPSTLTLDTTALQVNGGTVTVNAVGFVDAGDTFTLSGGTATARLVVNSGAGSDAITTGTGNDLINAGNGDNTITSNDGDDTVNSGSGVDTINTGTGTDTVNSGAGADVITTGDGNDTVSAGDGADTVRGQLGNDTLNGDAGDDTLYGDIAYGDIAGTAYVNAANPGTQYTGYNASVGGKDTINGGIGNDTIIGGLLGDTLTGGDGADTFRYQTRDDSRVFPGGIDNRDTITDFVSGSDKIDLLSLPEATGQTVRFNGNWDTFGEGQGAISGTGGDGFLDVVYVRETDTLWVDIDNNGQLNGEDMQIILQGVDNLVAADVNNPHLVTGPSIQHTMGFEQVSALLPAGGPAISLSDNFAPSEASSGLRFDPIAWHSNAFA